MTFRIPVVLALLALSVLSIWYFSLDDQRRTEGISDYDLVFPDLIEQINDVREIRVRSFQNSVSLTLQDTVWQVSKFDNYPAQPSTVSNFLIGFAQMRKIEPKTSDSDKFAALDLAGIEIESSLSVQVDLLTQDKRMLASLLVGKRRQSVRSVLLTELHVREPHADQTWLVESGLTIPVQAIDWIHTEILNLDEQVDQVTIESLTNQPIKVRRDPQERENFLLEDIPESHKIRYQFRLNEIGGIFRRLIFEDVKRVSDWESSITVTARTTDNLLVSAEFGNGELINFVSLTAQAMENSTPEVVKKAESLNKIWSGWKYQVSDVRRETAELTIFDLVEPTEGFSNSN